MQNDLSEIIFEIRWGNQDPFATKGELLNSPDYNILLGRFFEEFKSDFLSIKPLPTAGMPEGISRGIVQYMLRKSVTEEFPLVQIGSGIFSVNSNVDNWNEFSKTIVNAVDKFTKISKDITLDNLKISLTFIMAREFDSDKEDLQKFIFEKLGIQVAFNKNRDIKNMNSVSFQTKIPIESPVGELIYVASEGKKRDKKALVWQSKIQTDIQNILSNNELEKWLSAANLSIRKWLLF